MRKVLHNPSQIITVDTKGKNYKRGNELNEINSIENHSIILEDGIIKDVLPNSSLKLNSSNTTVKAVREASIEELINLLTKRVKYFISQGITSLEIKSGYGLDYENELKLLQAINYLKDISPIDIVPTFLGAHTFPPEFKDDHEGYIDLL